MRAPSTIVSMLSAGALALSLAACDSNGGDTPDPDEMDAALTDDSEDPAMTGALEDQILVDPDLTDQSNQNAASRANGSRGTVPADTGGEGGKKAADAELGANKLSAPKPTRVAAGECTDCAAGGSTMTLGAMAEGQSGGACTQRLNYDMGWATRMPAAFPVYPRARLKEAAGIDGGSCNIRAVTFTTDSIVKDVVDYYYTKARRAGFSAEYQMQGSEHILGGTNENTDGAYVVFMRRLEGGRTEVDIVANNGR